MTIRKFEDGSEFGTKELVFSVVAGAIIGATLYNAKCQYENWKLKRIMKKHGWSQEAIDRV